MSSVTYFEIGGDLVELHADYKYATGQITAKKRKQQRAVARDLKSIGKTSKKMSKAAESRDEWGPAEAFGYGVGLGAGIAFAVITFPVVAADGPLIGPADLAWLAASMRIMSKTTTTGRQIGEKVDDHMGW